MVIKVMLSEDTQTLHVLIAVISSDITTDPRICEEGAKQLLTVLNPRMIQCNLTWQESAVFKVSEA